MHYKYLYTLTFIIPLQSYVVRLKKSFTLIEISVVLAVLGALVSLSIKATSGLYSKYKYKANQKKIEVIQEALQTYFTMHKRLPAPASYLLHNQDTKLFGSECDVMGNDGVRDWTIYTTTNQQRGNGYHENIGTNYRLAICESNRLYNTVRYGIVPFKELGLSQDDVTDMYGNFFEYYAISHVIDPIDTHTYHGAPETFTKKGYTTVYYNETEDANNPQHACGNRYGTTYGSSSDSDYPCGSEKMKEGQSLSMIEYYYYNYTNATDSNNGRKTWKVPPYGIRIKDVETTAKNAASTKFLDQNGTVAYAIVSHGEDGGKTCALKPNSTRGGKPQKIAKLTATNADDRTKFSAQNCLNVGTNNTFGIKGRDMFRQAAAANHSPFIFYKGEKTKFFDDQIGYETLGGLLYKAGLEMR